MKILILGGGLIGITTAWYLSAEGHRVTVVERHEEPARETSFANGALLTPSMSEPWNSPGVWRQITASVFRSDSPIQIGLRAVPGLLGWGAQFLRNSTAVKWHSNAIHNFRLGLYSRELMHVLQSQNQLQYSQAARGTLRIFRTDGKLDAACAKAHWLKERGANFRRLPVCELIELEPALAPIAGKLAGAVHFEVDETGDAHEFCREIAVRARARGVEFLFNTVVTSLEQRRRAVSGVQSSRGSLVADAYIVAAGSYSVRLLKGLDIHLPIQPVKGYSLTFEATRRAPGSLQIPVIDDDLHAALVPLGNSIRVAGMAGFAGFDLRLNPVHIRNLARLANQMLPEADLNPRTARAWCGLRPMSVDGIPIIGKTPLDNLWVSGGHGHLGWTLAAGSGQLLSDLVSHRAPLVDPTPFALSRFH